MSFSKKVLWLLLCMALVVALSLTCFADNTGEEKIGTCLATSPMGDIQIVDGSDTDVDWDAVRVTIREAAMAMQETIDLSSFGISASNENVLTLRNFLFNEPCILRNIYSFQYASTTSAIVTIYPTYTYTKAQFDSMYSACQDVIQTMLYGVKDNASLSTAQKVLLVHDRLATWSEYDYANLQTKTVPESSYSPYGVLVLKVGVCDGYARAFSWIMDELGIENYYVSSQSLNHAWNIVVIDGEKYYVDATFDDPTYDITGRVNHKNLLVSYNTLKSNHNASDFDTDANSTKYESMFWSGVTSECVTINGNIYYISVSGNTPTIKKVTSNGSISTVRSLGTQIWYASSSGYYQGCFTRLAACGTALLYSTPTEIRSYDTATGNDTLVWKPSLSGYSAYTYIYGMTLKDGVIYCELATSPTGSSSNRIILTKSFCTHKNTKVLSNSATCVNAGQIQRICTDCRKVTREASSATGIHTYGNWTVVKAATCVGTGSQSRTCSVCNKVETQTIAATGKHTYGNWTVVTPATCGTAGTETKYCTVCNAAGESRSIAATGKHTYGDWSVVKAPTCVDTGTETKFCTVCKAAGESRSVAATGIHTYGDWTVVTPAGCVTTGTETKFCTVCQAAGESRSIAATGHSFTLEASTPPTCGCDGSRTKICSKCYAPGESTVIPATGNHTYKDWTVVTPATCGTAGTETQFCTVCHKAGESRSIAATGKHTYGDWTVVTSATCGTAGTETKFCTVCNAAGESRSIAATGKHTYGDWTVVTPATCASAGTETKFCTVCKATGESRSIAATGKHTYGDWTVVTPATCGTAGTETKFCTVCKAAGESRSIAATGKHTYGNWSVVKAATCVDAGSQSRTCSVCKNVETQTIAATGKHTYGDWMVVTPATCGTAGTETKFCTVCKVAGESRSIAATGKHTYGNWSVVKAATCVDAGSQSRTCSVCNIVDTQTIAATGKHTYGDWTVVTPATCGTAGTETKFCTVCKAAGESRSIAATGNHTYGDWTVVTPATCVTSGTETKFCTVCKAAGESRSIEATGIHTYGEWTVTTEATYSSEGERTRTCQYCDAVEREAIPRKTLGTPSITKIENVATGVKITWNPVEGATKYRVYYKLSGTSKWSKFDTTVTSATVTDIDSGEGYLFSVKAYADGTWSDNTISSPFVYCAMPTVSKAENTSSGVKLTWNKIVGATKYRVYYRLSTASKYTKFKDVTGTSVTVTGLTAGKSYIFTVKAYNGSTWSANKASSAVLYRPVPTVSKLTNAAKGITVTWTKISGATKYALYYKVSGASSWTRVSNTLTANSATVTGLTSGKSYVFTVKAYVGGGWSTNVSSSAIVRVNAVTLSGLTNSASKTMKATWKKDTTLTGYQIQYSLKSDFSNAKTVTVKSNSTVSQTIKSLTKGKTYYVRIRGYKTVNSVTTYGAWSSAKSVKISK